MNNLKKRLAVGMLWSIIAGLNCINMVACASMIQFTQKVDNELVPYVKEYKDLLGFYCKHNDFNVTYEVVFETDDYYTDAENPKKGITWAGLCETKFNGFKIAVKKSLFLSSAMNETLRRELMFHELSHCFLKQPHSNEDENVTNYHYMNHTLVRLPDDLLMEQVRKDIKKYCVGQ